MNLGAPELLILLFGAVPYAVIIWRLVDAAGRPDWADPGPPPTGGP